MTRAGEENRFGKFILDDEQAERITAGDMSAVWEFIEQNRDFLTCWARKFIRVRLAYMPEGFYEVDELLNQIYIDFPFYKVDDRKSLCVSIFHSFFRISCGGLTGRYIRENKEEFSFAVFSFFGIIEMPFAICYGELVAVASGTHIPAFIFVYAIPTKAFY